MIKIDNNRMTITTTAYMRVWVCVCLLCSSDSSLVCMRFFFYFFRVLDERIDCCCMHIHYRCKKKMEKQNKTSVGKKHNKEEKSAHQREREERKDGPVLHVEYVSVTRRRRFTRYLFAIKSRCNVILLLNVYMCTLFLSVWGRH